MKFKLLTLIFICSFLTLSCNDDNENESEPESITYLCCEENPFENQNVDILDQTNGEIYIYPLFTPNGDAYYDTFPILNIQHYPNNSVTLYNLNDDIVYSVENYGNTNDLGWANFDDLESGSYKYKVVIENEQTFVEYGYVCLVRTAEDGADFSFFTECSLEGGYIDPIIGN